MIILTFGFCRVNKDGHDHSRFFSLLFLLPTFLSQKRQQSGSIYYSVRFLCGMQTEHQ